MDGVPAPDALRELVREVLKDVLPTLAARNGSRSFASGTPPAPVSAPPGLRIASSGPSGPRPGSPAVPPTPPTSDPPPSPPAGMEGVLGAAGVSRVPGAAGVSRVPGAAGVRRVPGAAGVSRVPGAAGVSRVPGAAGVSRVPGAAGVSRVPGAAGVSRVPGAVAAGLVAGASRAPGRGAHRTASEPGVTPQPVRLATDEDLHEFALQIVRLADNPKRRRDLLAGRLRFTLASAGSGLAPVGGPVNGRGSLVPAGHGGGDHRIERGAVTERAVQAAASAGARLVLGPRAVLTPLARDRARALGVPIEKER
jgi:hypothetical protein